MMQLTILGSGSALPLPERATTAQLLQFDRAHYLIDCGEGTQVQMRKAGVWTAKLRAVFISHLHGDHYLGLMGLLWSMELTGRRRPLHIIGPPKLKDLIAIHFDGMQAELGFPLEFINLENGAVYADDLIEVQAFVVDHRITCHGFIFTERQKLRSIIKEKVLSLGLLPFQYLDLRTGLDITLSNGAVIANRELTLDPPRPRKYVYVTDTSPTFLPAEAYGCDLLYHEATFLTELQERAHQTGHSTTVDAAKKAIEIDAKKLILGHFSSRYTDLDQFLVETRGLFQETYLAKDLATFNIY